MMSLPPFDPETYDARRDGEVPSPCINICQMNVASGLCDGCCRTIEEITDWRNASTATRLDIWRQVRERHHQIAYLIFEK